MRFTCKMCQKTMDNSYEAKAQRSLCKKCHADIDKYRRILKRESLEIEHITFRHKMEEMFKRNSGNGGYVPYFYRGNGNIHTNSCAYCGVDYKSNVRSEQCPECERVENRYRVLLRTAKPGSAALRRVELHYQIQLMNLFKVPKLYLERAKEKDPHH